MNDSEFLMDPSDHVLFYISDMFTSLVELASGIAVVKYQDFSNAVIKDFMISLCRNNNGWVIMFYMPIHKEC